jgi:hypothetical protein
MSPDDLQQLELANARAHAKICVIEFGRTGTPRAGNFLSQIADRTGGQYGYINTGTLSK